MIYDEEYVERQLEEDNIWYSKHDAELNSLRKSINLFLSTNNTKSIYSLCECFDSSDLSETFKAVPDIAYCIIAITISMNEFNMNIDTLFLKNVLNIQDTVNKINKYKFLLLNIEFDNDKTEALRQITENLNTNLSSVALFYLIKCCSVDTQYVFNEICDYLINDTLDNSMNKYNELMNIYNELVTSM